MRAWKFLFCLFVGAAAAFGGNLVENGGFESGLTGWRPFWTRQPGAGGVFLDRRVVHSGTGATRIEHQGTADWSFEPQTRLSVQAGDIFELEVWAKMQGSGSLTLCASTWDAQGGNVSWTEGERTANGLEGWTRLTSRFVVPAGVSQIQPRLIGYGGHGLCMAFWGVTDDRQGYCAIIETPDDAAIQLRRMDGLLTIRPGWDAQKGRFGYGRRLRYVFFDRGGHVAMAKRYREYARQAGRLKTLAEKRRENPNVDLLAGAVNVWNWDSDPVDLVQEMQAAGIQRILWSRGGGPEALRSLNRLHVLTSRYDIYQDVMNPENFPLLNWVDYFEGMLSLGPYRVPDAGRNMQRIWDQVPERVAKFQLGQAYRLPLWELVYHDCVVAQWYWGDYSNKLPSLWDKRDLFNILYGTPPMFMLDRNLWRSQKERFAQSYRNTCPFVRAAAYAEMTDHRFLTPDRNVQQTTFANGITITVNFGDVPCRLSSGEVLLPGGFHVSGMPKL